MTTGNSTCHICAAYRTQANAQMHTFAGGRPLTRRWLVLELFVMCQNVVLPILLADVMVHFQIRRRRCRVICLHSAYFHHNIWRTTVHQRPSFVFNCIHKCGVTQTTFICSCFIYAVFFFTFCVKK